MHCVSGASSSFHIGTTLLTGHQNTIVGINLSQPAELTPSIALESFIIFACTFSFALAICFLFQMVFQPKLHYTGLLIHAHTQILHIFFFVRPKLLWRYYNAQHRESSVLPRKPNFFLLRCTANEYTPV